MKTITMLKLKSAGQDFQKLHPKFSDFMKENYFENLKEGTLIKVIIQPPEGESSASAMKVTKSDLKLLQTLKKEINE